MPQPHRIEEKKQLLVEGNDQRNFFEAFLKHLNRQDVQIQNFGGINELRGFLTDCPRVSVLILPDGRSPGMLETLLNRSFADDSVNGCIDVFFQCVNDLPGRQIQKPEKARTHAYLSTRPEPQFSVGVAAKNNYWDLDHEEFEPIRSFLAGL